MRRAWEREPGFSRWKAKPSRAKDKVVSRSRGPGSLAFWFPVTQREGRPFPSLWIMAPADRTKRKTTQDRRIDQPVHHLSALNSDENRDTLLHQHLPYYCWVLGLRLEDRRPGETPVSFSGVCTPALVRR